MGILEIGSLKASERYDVSSDADAVNVEYRSCDGYGRYIVAEPYAHETPGKIKTRQIIELIEEKLDFEQFSKERDDHLRN
jgi:hypothetical protein